MEKKEVNRLHLLHTGKILSNFCILGGVFMLVFACMPVMSFFWYVVGGLIVAFAAIFKLLTFWQAPYDLEALVDLFFGAGMKSFASGVYGGMRAAFPYVFVATLLLAGGAIALIAVFDDYKRRGRIAVASVCVGLGLIALIVYALLPELRMI